MSLEILAFKSFTNNLLPLKLRGKKHKIPNSDAKVKQN